MWRVDTSLSDRFSGSHWKALLRSLSITFPAWEIAMRTSR